MGISVKDLGIDLGTANTIIYNEEAGILLNEATAIAYDKYTGDIVAVGNKAKAMYGKAPRNIEVIKPLQDGVISDFDMTAEMLEIFIKQAIEGRRLNGMKVVVGVPSDVTEVERRAVIEVVQDIGGKEVFVIDEPMAAAIGAGLDIEDSEASMITDIGGGTTDVAILSLGGIVVSTSIRHAGDKMTEAVIAYIRRKKGVLIGNKTAEDLKVSVGSVLLDKDENGEEIVKTVNARGRELVSGLPKTFEVTNKDLQEALSESVDTIIDAIKNTVEKAPPEIAADIAEKGMVLSGGASLLENFDKLIANKTGMKVTRAENPYEAVAIGTGMSLNNIERLRVWANVKIRQSKM